MFNFQGFDPVGHNLLFLFSFSHPLASLLFSLKHIIKIIITCLCCHKLILGCKTKSLKTDPLQDAAVARAHVAERDLLLGFILSLPVGVSLLLSQPLSLEMKSDRSEYSVISFGGPEVVTLVLL